MEDGDIFSFSEQSTVTAPEVIIKCPFESSSKPDIPAGLYFHIICQKINIPEEHTILVLILIERAIESSKQPHSNFYTNAKIDNIFDNNFKIKINSLTIHRLMIVATLITQKFYSDQFYSNSYIAQIGGIELIELNWLEQIFIKIIDWDLTVYPDDYKLF